MPNRTYSLSSGSYRFGFNGKENDNEVKGDGNQQDYGMRISDPRLGRFLSVDPLADNYPWYTPYQFAGNTPIWAVDLDGLEEAFATQKFDPVSGKNLTILELNPNVEQRNKDVGKIQFKYRDGSSSDVVTMNDYFQHFVDYMKSTLTDNDPQTVIDMKLAIDIKPEPSEAPVVTKTDDKAIEKKVETSTPTKKKTPPIPIARTVEPAPIVPPIKLIPPPAPLASKMCHTCFIGISDLHWRSGIRDVSSWLRNNPNYNLSVLADGGGSLFGLNKWTDKPALSSQTFSERLNERFQKFKEALGSYGNRVSLSPQNADGSKFEYKVKKQ